MDIKQTITNSIIDMLEQGSLENRPLWNQALATGLPRNGTTGLTYSGVNILILWNCAVQKSYSSNVWLTYKQAAELGGHVRAGEKSVMCVYFDMVKAKDQRADDEESFYPMCKPFWLFNVAQIDQLPPALYSVPRPDSFHPIDEAEQVLANSNAAIHHGYEKACYVPVKDQIFLPYREAFTCPETYYATALHELTHWTGHQDRLNRDFNHRFGSDGYAFEELIAEIGSAFVCAHLGFVDATLADHASYLGSWIKVLKNDKNAIFTASRQASLAADFILKKAKQNSCCERAA